MPFNRADRKRVTLDTGEELITKQSHKDECDIHNILGQYKKTGIITHVQSARPQYTDLPSDMDYQSSLNTLMQAEQAFAELPATVRDHFHNDPGEFLAAFSDEKQEDKLREFGLITSEKKETPPKPAQTAPEPSSELGGGPGGGTKPPTP